MNSIGSRVYLNIERPDKALMERFRNIPASNIGDMMGRLYCMRSEIRSWNNLCMLGSAFTVKAPMGDNAMMHYALDLAKPGDIIVVDGSGACDRALCGEIMFTYAEKRGLAGIVVDGAIRDVDGARALHIPIYAKAVCPQGPYKNGPGEINVPIACGGQVVFPGDILVGDPDGIVVIHKEDAAEIVDMANEKVRGEDVILGNYRKGILDEREHFETFDTLLKKRGVTIIEK